MTQLAEGLWYDRRFLCHDSPLSLLKGCDKTDGYFLMMILKVCGNSWLLYHGNPLMLLKGCDKTCGYFS